MSENQNPGEPGPGENTGPGEHAEPGGAPGFPGIPAPSASDPSATLPGPNTAGYLPGGRRAPEGSPLPTPFDPDRGYAPGPVPLGRNASDDRSRHVGSAARIALLAGGLVVVIGIVLALAFL